MSASARQWLVALAIVVLVAGAVAITLIVKQPSAEPREVVTRPENPLDRLELPDTAEMEQRVRRVSEGAHAAVTKDSKSADAWRELGAVLDAHRLFAPAAQCYRESLSLQPSDFATTYYLAIVSEGLVGGLDGAVELFQQAISLRSEYTAAYIRLGDALLKQGNPQAARDAYLAALGPADFETLDCRRMTETDFLPRWRAAETTDASDGSVNLARALRCLNDNLDASTVGRSVGFGSDQFDDQKVVPVAWISKQCVVVTVPSEHTTELMINVLISVVVDIGKRHTVSLLQMAETARCGDVLKANSPVISHHDVGDERLEVRISGGQIKVEKSVIIEVAEVSTHGHIWVIDAHARCDVGERAIAVVSIKAGTDTVMISPKSIGHDVRELCAVSRDKQIKPPIVVVVKEPRGEAAPGRFGHTGRFRHVGECSVAVVLVKAVRTNI